MTNAANEQVQLPSALEAEQGLLGAIFIYPDALRLSADIVQAEHFAEPIHQLIYGAALSLSERGETPTPQTVRPYLPDQKIGEMTMFQYLAALCSHAAIPAHVLQFARSIADIALRRAVIAAAQDTITRASTLSAGEPAEILLDEQDEIVSAMRSGFKTAKVQTTSIFDAIGSALRKAEEKRSGKAAPVPTTGFSDLDRAMGGGLPEGRLIVLAGRPGMGKTQTLISIARNTARRGNGVGIFSLEIDNEETGARFASCLLSRSVTPIKYSDIVGGNLTPGEADEVMRAYKAAEDYPVEIDCSPSITVAQIERRAKEMDAKMQRMGTALKVLFIDYLQLITPSNRYKGNKVNEIGEIVHSLKQMSKRLNLCVVLLSQLSRDVEKREDKRPTKADLRDSGNIEEHADVIALLYRPAYYDDQLMKLYDRGANPKLPDGFLDDAPKRKNDLEIILDKNRLGPTTAVVLYCVIERALLEGMRQ